MIYINDDTTAESLITRLLNSPPTLYPFDIETAGLDPRKDDILLIQFIIPQTGELYVINCRKVNVRRIIEALWREGRGALLGHNLKFDLSFLLAKYPHIYFHDVYDTFIADILITNGIVQKPPSLDELSEKYLGIKLNKENRKSFIGYKGDEFPQKLLDYAATDIEVLLPIFHKQQAHISKMGLGLVVDIECKAVSAFAMMETNGIFMDRDKWVANEVYAKNKRRDVLLQMDHFARPYFKPLISLFDEEISSINWNSPLQLLTLLRKVVDERMPDTNENTLKQYSHELINLLLEYREYNKMITSYGDSVLSLASDITGRLHPSFNQIGARTGRVSCREPNVQQVPKSKVTDSSGKTHYIYREAFVPQCTTGVMVGADYSSFELRVITDLTEEPTWIKGYEKNLDMHSIVAQFIFGVPVSKEQHPELREIGKSINFGVSYGMGATKLAVQMSSILKRNVEMAEAGKILRKFFEKFPKIRTWQDAYVSHSLKEKKLVNPYDGRSLSIEGKDQTNGKILAAIRNEAKNYPCQSTNATVIKLAMIKLCRYLFDNKCKTKLVNTIHDELLCESDSEEEAKIIAPVLKKIMEDAGSKFIKRVPVVVESYIAPYWKKN